MKFKNQKTEIQRYNPQISQGLTFAELKQRNKDKLFNVVKQKSDKSVFRIFTDNIFTFFNAIWVIIFVALVLVAVETGGGFENLLFMIVIFINTLISIIQEIKAKITVEKLSLTTMPKIIAIRNGKQHSVMANKLVLDDVIKLDVGDSIPADCIVLEGKIEVNESLLTGESDGIAKKEGDKILSGSFIISGTCYARVDKIGKYCYIQTIAKEAKRFKSPSSNLNRDLSLMIKYIGIGIIPIGALMFINNYFTSGRILEVAITNTSAALIGMVPAGMYLLVTVALALGVIKLARKRTLVKDLYSIEMLARSDVLCLDKTGTITDGTMEVTDLIELQKIDKLTAEQMISNILFCQKTTNATSSALLEKFGKQGDFEMLENIEFNSKRKVTATSFKKVGTFIIGAPEFSNCNLSDKIQKQIYNFSKIGKRVLLVSYNKKPIKKENEIPVDNTAVALVTIEDHIREDAKQTIEWFKQNNVKIKIISGDNPITVSNIAGRVGVENSENCISLEGMSLREVEQIATRFTVFGRVSPEQKHVLVKSLKKQGHIVAMTGDGVNDTLALKESDCSIAMADGSAVARNLSNLVLMDSKFSSLPAVVKEGRQVINNVMQSSTLFLMKTVFTILLSFFTIITISEYPFEPANLFVLEFFVIGIPSVVLAIQPSDKLIKGEFITTVLKRSIPSGLLLFLNVFIIVILQRFNFFLVEEYYSLVTLVLTLTALTNLGFIAKPYNLLKKLCVTGSALCIVVVYLILGNSFGVTMINWTMVLVALIAIVLGVAFNYLAVVVSKKLSATKLFKTLEEKISKSTKAMHKKQEQKLAQKQKEKLDKE